MVEQTEINRPRLEDQPSSSTDARAPGATGAEAALLAIVDRLCGELQRNARRSTLDSSLERDLGLDSLARVELVLRIEHDFRVKLPEATLGNAQTVRDLLTALTGAGEAVPLPKAITPRATDEIEAPPDTLATLPEVLAWHAGRHASRVHIVFQAEDGSEQKITYAELWQRALRVAANLRERGVEPGQSVALMLPTGPGYFASFMGVMAAGGVPVPIYPPARITQIEDHFQRHAGILSNAQAVLLITVPEAKQLARLLTTRIETLHGIATPDELDQPTSLTLPPHPARADDIAFLQYTSGSTGNPKGVVLTHRNVLANLRAMGRVTRLDARDAFVSWLPLYHDMGLIGGWFASLYYGFPLIVMSPLTFLARPERWLWAMHRHRGTVSAAPNFAYELCLRKIDDAALEGLDLSSVRWLCNGSESVSAETMQAFAARFAKYGLSPGAIAPVYGLAECTLGLGFPPAGRGLKVDAVDRDALVGSGFAKPAQHADRTALRFVACGRPIPDHEVRIVDAMGQELGDRREGRLEFKGPSVTRGYFRNPEKTAEIVHGEWVDSGDLAYIAEGDIYLTGRIKDVIIRGGRHIYPQEVEEAVGAIDGVRKGCVAAFGSPDPLSATERFVVLAETRETDPAARERLRAAINTKVVDLLGLPPDVIELAPLRTVLKTSSGKLRRSATRMRYEEGGKAGAPRAVWWQIVRLAVADLAPAARRLSRTAGEVLFGIYAWLMFALLAPVAWLIAVLLPRPAWSWTAARYVARTFFALCTKSFTVRGLERLPQGGTCILAINHSSYLDGLAIAAALPRPFSFVAKQELAGNFVSRLFLRRIGSEFVERFDPARGVEDAERLTALVQAGTSLAFFPEGTFTRIPGLRPFRLGAFVAATRAQAPIVPVVMRGTRSILRGDDWRPHAAAIAIVVCDPIRPEGSDWDAAIRLRDAVRTEILRRCGEPDLA